MNTCTSYIHVDQRSISSSVNVMVFKANVQLHLNCNSAYTNKSVFCNNVDKLSKTTNICFLSDHHSMN